VRANADTPQDAWWRGAFGATGIGLCRTEHMFFEGERILAVREMILADDEAGRRKRAGQAAADAARATSRACSAPWTACR
jgi:phosphoenolpyruvate synthase/pyruvate phosphate dikinase